MTEDEFRTGVWADGRRMLSSAEAQEICLLIDQLRAEEGASVTICNDYPDFGGPDCVVVVEAPWIKGHLPDAVHWHPVKSFYGPTILQCLRDAAAEKAAS